MTEIILQWSRNKYTISTFFSLSFLLHLFFDFLPSKKKVEKKGHQGEWKTWGSESIKKLTISKSEEEEASQSRRFIPVVDSQ